MIKRFLAWMTYHDYWMEGGCVLVIVALSLYLLKKVLIP